MKPQDNPHAGGMLWQFLSTVRVHMPDKEAPKNLLTQSQHMVSVEALQIYWVLHPLDTGQCYIYSFTWAPWDPA